MDRESFDVSVSASGDDTPVLEVRATNPALDLGERLTGRDGETLPAADVDVTYRETDGTSTGVLALANRLTGEFVLEANAASERVFELVEAVLATGEDEHSQYGLRLTDDQTTDVSYEKETLLVYDDAGNLQRGRSLIPGSVEL